MIFLFSSAWLLFCCSAALLRYLPSLPSSCSFISGSTPRLFLTPNICSRARARRNIFEPLHTPLLGRRCNHLQPTTDHLEWCGLHGFFLYANLVTANRRAVVTANRWEVSTGSGYFLAPSSCLFIRDSPLRLNFTHTTHTRVFALNRTTSARTLERLHTLVYLCYHATFSCDQRLST